MINNKIIKDIYLSTMKADSIPEGWSGLWFVRKISISEPTIGDRAEKQVLVPIGSYTYLYRITNATLNHDPPGEVVMEEPLSNCRHI